MNRDETIKAIEVMQAWVDGKTVQAMVCGVWQDMPANVTWDWADYTFRIKPEPRVCWRLVSGDGTYGAAAFDCQEKAMANVIAYRDWVGIRKFVEVLE